MARKRTKIGKLNYRDYAVIKLIRDFGFATKEDMRALGVSEKRIINYARKTNKITEKIEVRINGKKKEAYILGSKGKREAEIFGDAYGSPSKQHDHDQKEYVKSKGLHALKTYQNESNIRANYADKIKEVQSRAEELKIIRMEETEKELREAREAQDEKLVKILENRLKGYEEFGFYLSTVDGIYYDEASEMHIVETYTDNYKEHMKEAKRNFVRYVLKKEVSSIEWVYSR